MYAHDPAGITLFAADADQPGQRRQFKARLEVSVPIRERDDGAVSRVRVFASHPHRCQRRHVSAQRQARVALEPETGKEIWSYEMTIGQSVRSWRLLLARRSRQSAAHHLHRRQTDARAERQDRQGRSWLRQRRRSGSGGALQFAARPFSRTCCSSARMFRSNRRRG